MQTKIKERPMTETIVESYNIAGVNIIVPKLRKRDYSPAFIAIKGFQHAIKKGVLNVKEIELDDDHTKDKYFIIVTGVNGSSRVALTREDQMYIDRG